MNQVQIDKSERSVREFFLSKTAGEDSVYVEIDGVAVAIVVPLPAGPEGDEPWTEVKNNRRCDLIEKKYHGPLSADEAVELSRLQHELFRHAHRTAPVPSGGRGLQGSLNGEGGRDSI